MNIKAVAKLDELGRFTYWIKERCRIYYRRAEGKPKPWTDDEVLQNYFFTNPYREWDKTTAWFRCHVRDPRRNHPSVLMATVIFRWFNYIPTGQFLLDRNLYDRWDMKRAVRMLNRRKRDQGKLFTGAYMIKALNGVPKVEGVSQCIDALWRDRRKLIAKFQQVTSLQEAHKLLTPYRGLGGFMAYEIITDLRHTYLLTDAVDINTWCHLGPGAWRGLYRMHGIEPPRSRSGHYSRHPSKWIKPIPALRRLLTQVNRRLGDLPKFEMREVEHSLCEWDKYERIRLNQGPSKRLYDGRA